MVSGTAIAAIVISLIIAVGTPVILLVLFKKKFGISLKVMLFGMLTFFLFAQVLEGSLHGYFLAVNDTTKKALENPWLFMLYGGLMAGIFEETGRLVFMKYVLKKYREWKDGLAFGLGHGGFEAILLVGINSIVMLVFAFMINNGTFEALLVNEQARQALLPLQEQLAGGEPYMILLGGIERLSALAIHMGLSILVLLSITRRKASLFIGAILLHAIIDFPPALYQAGVIKNIFVIEAIILVIGIGFVWWIIKSRRLFHRE